MAKIKPVRQVKTHFGTYSLHFYSPDGRRRRLSVGRDHQIAQRLAIRFMDWLLEGKDPEQELERTEQTSQARMMTLHEFHPLFMENHGSYQSQAMQEVYRYRFRNICRCPEIAEVPMSSISKRVMLEYMTARLKEDNVKEATVNRDASFVRGMLSKAAEWDIIDRNPIQGLKLLKESGKRDVRLTPEQILPLLEQLTAAMANVVEFAIYSGFRKENILSLRIESVRLNGNVSGQADVVVKGGRRETFPLGAPAAEVLTRAIGRRRTGYVFLNPETDTRYRSINRTFDRAVRKVGLQVNGTKLRFHDLRHIFATWLHKEGVSLDTLRPLLGHRERSTTDRYTSTDRLELGNVLDLMPRIRDYKEAASGEK